MLKYTLLLISLIVTGCATHQPTATTKVVQSADNPNKPKYQLYVPPEEIWPEEYQTGSRVCASPFRGSILQR
jgi:uncharacterized protein YcfL